MITLIGTIFTWGSEQNNDLLALGGTLLSDFTPFLLLIGAIGVVLIIFEVIVHTLTGRK